MAPRGIIPAMSLDSVSSQQSAPAYRPTATVQATTLAGQPTSCFALVVGLNPASVSLQPGGSASVTLGIARIDSAPSVTLTPSLEAGSILEGYVGFEITTANPTTGNLATLVVTQTASPPNGRSAQIDVAAADNYGSDCVKSLQISIVP